MDFKSTIQRDVLPEEQPPTAWDASAAITSPSSNQTFPPPLLPPPQGVKQRTVESPQTKSALNSLYLQGLHMY